MTTHFRLPRLSLFSPRPRRAPKGVAPREWHYFSPDSPLVQRLVAEMRAAGRSGFPDPVHGTAAPATFAESNECFSQLIDEARNKAYDEIEDDIEFVVANAPEVLAARQTPLPNAPEDRERVARLDAEFGRRLARLEVREARHEAEVDELTYAARMTTSLLEGTWKAYHPHPDYLGHFPIPQFRVPDGAHEIGQARVRAALAMAANLARGLGENGGDWS